MLKRRVNILAYSRRGYIHVQPPWQKPMRGSLLNREHPLARGLLTYYLLNEYTGERIHDLTGNGHNADDTWSNLVWGKGGIEGIATNAHVRSLPANLNLFDIGTGPYTFAAKLFYTPTTDAQYLFSINHYDPGFVIGASASNNRMLIYDSTSIGFDNATLQAGGLFNLAWVRESTAANGVKVYMDGVFKDDGTHSASISLTSVLVLFGPDVGGNYGLQSVVHWMGFWNRALTPEEIAWLYREPYAMFSQPRRVSFLVPKYPYADKHYSRGDEEVLPSDDREMETPFVIADYTGVAADDDVYVLQTAEGQYGIFRFDEQNVNSTDAITLTCKLKASLAPSSSVVKLQILNRNTPAWEDLDTDNATAADTEFTLTGTQSTNLSNYYDSENWVSFRVWQGPV